MTTTTQRTFPNATYAARVWASEHGISGKVGGWLYHQADTKDETRRFKIGGKGFITLPQGWDSLSYLLQDHGILAFDSVTRRWTLKDDETR